MQKKIQKPQQLPQFRKLGYLLLLLPLSACNSGNSQSATSSGSLQLDVVATVPVLANKSTTTVIYIHNTSDHEIDNISYSAINNSAKVPGDEFKLNQKSCTSIAAHGACALEFTTPELSAKDGNAQGSALIRANFMQDGKASYSQQLINYSLLPVQSGLNISSDIKLQANQYGTVYVYAESGNYDLQSIDSNNPQINETKRSSQTLTSPQVVAVELSAGAINQTQSVRLNLNYKNQTTKNITNSQFSINATPATNGAILTAGQLPILNTTQSTSGQMLIYNSGNQSTTLGAISGTNNISIVNTGNNRCISNSTNLAAGDSCIVYFTVPQVGNSGTISVGYGSAQLIQTATWYNSINEALLQMVASPSTVSFDQNSTSNPITITATNIGGYDLTGVSIPPATNPDGGSATTTTSTALSCEDSNNVSTGTNLPVGGSCTYVVTLTDSVAEANKNLLVKIGGNYITSLGAATYQRSTAVSYTSISVVPPSITITSTINWGQIMMGNAYSFTATITGGSSTVTPTVAGITGNTVSPASCALDSAAPATSSCTFIVTGSYSLWNPAIIANSTDVNNPRVIYTNSNVDLSVTATNNAIINGSASPQTFDGITGTVTAPYVYLPQTGQTPTSPITAAAGMDGYSHTGIPWAYVSSGSTVPNPRFTIGSGIEANCITDSLTGLMWVKDLNTVNIKNSSILGTPTSWQNALNSISDANAGAGYCGHTDWYLPTVNDLASLTNDGFTGGTNKYQSEWLISQGFINVQGNPYWSSSTYVKLTGNAWSVQFTEGNVVATHKVNNIAFVWPVRFTQ